MSDVTRILWEIESGDPRAAEQLLPLVYEELRKLAAARLANEKPGQTLSATALVHEAYLRLAGPGIGGQESGVVNENQPPIPDSRSPTPGFSSRGHFFAAAAEAMRRILIERARRKAGPRLGGDRRRLDLDQLAVATKDKHHDLLLLDDALSELERHDEQAAQLVKLRYFVGMAHHEAADALGIGRRAADRLWTVARAWLYQHLREQ
jgi:RNA polymerase sigma factor (TIGR02999 family)